MEWTAFGKSSCLALAHVPAEEAPAEGANMAQVEKMGTLHRRETNLLGMHSWASQTAVVTRCGFLHLFDFSRSDPTPQRSLQLLGCSLHREGAECTLTPPPSGLFGAAPRLVLRAESESDLLSWSAVLRRHATIAPSQAVSRALSGPQEGGGGDDGSGTDGNGGNGGDGSGGNGGVQSAAVSHGIAADVEAAGIDEASAANRRDALSDQGAADGGEADAEGAALAENEPASAHASAETEDEEEVPGVGEPHELHEGVDVAAPVTPNPDEVVGASAPPGERFDLSGYNLKSLQVGTPEPRGSG